MRHKYSRALNSLPTLGEQEINSIGEIDLWLSQFNPNEQLTARQLLQALRFVSRNRFAKWFADRLTSFDSEEPVAVFAVRKFPGEADGDDCVWDKDGGVVKRPAEALGSEEVIMSVIHDAEKRGNGTLLDHPSLSILRDEKVRQIVLLDDSIGSGGRVTEYVNAMLANATFLSWWSYGWVNLRIVTFARTNSGAKRIIHGLKGSNHRRRKFPTSHKVVFDSEYVFPPVPTAQQWGVNPEPIIQLCKDETKIPRKLRQGYGKSMLNLVFEHSVPNTTPGILWYGSPRWEPLFPNRVLPSWMHDVIHAYELKSRSTQPTCTKTPPSLSPQLIELLTLIKSGYSTYSTLAFRMMIDELQVKELINICNHAGFLVGIQLTPAGTEQIYRANVKPVADYDFSLYIPSSWCTD